MFFALAFLATRARTENQTLEVFAAASLHESIIAIAHKFESIHRGVTVHVNFGGSQQLAAEVSEGSPCDVFASADERNLDKIAYDPSTRRVFAYNRLVVVCPSDHPVIRRFRDLPAAKTLILAAVQVPVGAYSREALDKAAKVYGASWRQAIEANTVSNEQDVRQVLAKIVLGEADAGIVYISDARSSAGRVRTVSIPAQFQPRIVYPIAVNRGAANPALAKSFILAVLSPFGQSELRRRGFSSPR